MREAKEKRWESEAEKKREREGKTTEQDEERGLIDGCVGHVEINGHTSERPDDLPVINVATHLASRFVPVADVAFPDEIVSVSRDHVFWVMMPKRMLRITFSRSVYLLVNEAV